ncbi:MAG: hypothetical protein DMG69_06200 [Acidobacteria bacterium]|nr:MAG: hypothetical protein DMG69_06200 [Acidobacteriota bacterium]
MISGGLCLRCGKAPVVSKRFCKECLAKQNRSSEKQRAASPDKTREGRRRYNQSHPEVLRTYFQKRRHRLLSVGGEHTIEQWLSRVAYYGWRCAYCHCELTPKTLTKDHVIALSKGGTDWASNLVPACESCNKRKSARRRHPVAVGVCAVG